jgi:hypothetical protein
LLFQEDRFNPLSGKVIVLSNVSFEPAFEVVQVGLFHNNMIYPYPTGYKPLQQQARRAGCQNNLR